MTRAPYLACQLTEDCFHDPKSISLSGGWRRGNLFDKGLGPIRLDQIHNIYEEHFLYFIIGGTRKMVQRLLR
jgi:hypothetical protein